MTPQAEEPPIRYAANDADLPQHLRYVEGGSTLGLSRKTCLMRWSVGMAGFLGCPIYLVGSALLDFNSAPRDWDLRAEMDDRDFALRFGITFERWKTEGDSGAWTEGRWRWADMCVRWSKDASVHTALPIDFQVYPLTHVQNAYRFKPKLRLDARPT